MTINSLIFIFYAIIHNAMSSRASQSYDSGICMCFLVTFNGIEWFHWNLYAIVDVIVKNEAPTADRQSPRKLIASWWFSQCCFSCLRSPICFQELLPPSSDVRNWTTAVHEINLRSHDIAIDRTLFDGDTIDQMDHFATLSYWDHLIDERTISRFDSVDKKNKHKRKN